MNNLYFCNHCEVEIIIRVNKPHKNNLLMTEILKPAALESTQSRFKKLPLCEIKASHCFRSPNGGFE